MSLAEEVQYFHGRLFRLPLESQIVERYEAANRHCLPCLNADETRLVETVVARQLDLEAVELAVRFRQRNNVLTKKLQILLYLVEVRSQYFDYFINTRPRFGGAVFALLGSVARTGAKLVKGKYLIWRHALV